MYISHFLISIASNIYSSCDRILVYNCVFVVVANSGIKLQMVVIGRLSLDNEFSQSHI